MPTGSPASPPQHDSPRHDSAAATLEAPAPVAKPLARWAFLLSPRWLLGLGAASLLIQGGAYYWFHKRTAEAPPAVGREMKLGSFEYGRFNTREKQFQRGRFDLSVRLVENLGTSQRRQLEHQEQRFQQAVEETMRRARAADFNDPRFIRLRNHIQQRLNDELGFDWADEVMVNNPMVERPKDEAAASPADPAAGDDTNGSTDTQAPAAEPPAKSDSPSDR